MSDEFSKADRSMAIIGVYGLCAIVLFVLGFTAGVSQTRDSHNQVVAKKFYNVSAENIITNYNGKECVLVNGKLVELPF